LSSSAVFGRPSGPYQIIAETNQMLPTESISGADSDGPSGAPPVTSNIVVNRPIGVPPGPSRIGLPVPPTIVASEE
jgi:hypothetical protein